MNTVKHIFKEELINTYLDKYLSELIPDFDAKWNIIKKWRKSCEGGDLTSTKGTSVQGVFLSEIFGNVLGYSTVVDGGAYDLI